MKDLDLSRLETHIRRVLIIGVGVTALAFVAGLALWFGGSPRSTTVLNIGLMLLMAIPVTRIIASCADAIRRRDWLLTWSTLIVLTVMAVTLAHELLRE
jgi:uncharacterized membrane protein